MVFEMADFSGITWRTSHCSTIMPSSSNRKDVDAGVVVIARPVLEAMHTTDPIDGILGALVFHAVGGGRSR
jgi:hypothetical protein